MPTIPEAGPNTREFSLEPASSFDAARLSEDCLDNIGSTYTDSSDEDLEELEGAPQMSLETRDTNSQHRARLSSSRCRICRINNVSLNSSYERGPSYLSSRESGQNMSIA
jgi:hypothetical protein